MKVLVLNAGSSSQQGTLYELGETLPLEAPQPVWEAYIDWSTRSKAARLMVRNARGETLDEERPKGSRLELLRTLLDTLLHGPTQAIGNLAEIAVVGHRVVHGGQEFYEGVWVTPEVKASIARLAAFAPQHNPINLEEINALEQMLGTVQQVVVFDTAFYTHLPRATAVYPGPYTWFEQGIRRYGFHGLSHQYCAERAAQLLGRGLRTLRLITCHLASGCSLAAIREGQSIDTTMGFTPLDGLMMGSRSGSLDPGILTYLLRQPDTSVEQLEDTLNYSSGLQGISGISNDMREILAAIAEGNDRAQMAYEMYLHRLRAFIGAMLAQLGGADALVFTGGVGEHIAQVRAAACEAFAFLGLKLDAARNEQSPADTDIATPDSSLRVLIVRNQEDWMIARECWRLMRTL